MVFVYYCVAFVYCFFNLFLKWFCGIFAYLHWVSCMKVSIFCFNVSVCIVTMVLPISAFATVRLFCSKRVFICFRFYWCLLCSMLQVFVSAICLIFLIVRYLNVFYIVISKCLIAFSVSIINVLINCFGFFSIA